MASSAKKAVQAEVPANDAAVIDLTSLTQADTSVWLPTALIEMGPRLRPVDDAWSGALGDLMRTHGQKDAVDVCRVPGRAGWQVHGAGGHRFRAAQLRDIELLKVIVWPYDPDAAKLREIQDALQRRELDPMDRATMVAEYVACFKRLRGIDPTKDGRTASAQARWQKTLDDDTADATATIAVASGWSAEVGAQIGLSERSVRDLLMLDRRITPRTRELLREHRHPAATNAAQLRALAKLEPGEQEGAAEYLVWPGKSLSRPVPKTVAEAITAQRGTAQAVTPPDQKRLSTFVSTFTRMGLTEKKGALEDLAPHLPAGFTLLDKEAQAELALALEGAFTLLLQTVEGETPPDSEAIYDQIGRIQDALSIVKVEAEA